MDPTKGPIHPLDTESEQLFPRGWDFGTRRRTPCIGPVVCLLQLAEGLLRASGVGGELVEEGIELIFGKHGHHSAEAGLGGPGIQQLARLLLGWPRAGSR